MSPRDKKQNQKKQPSVKELQHRIKVLETQIKALELQLETCCNELAHYVCSDASADYEERE